MKRIGIVVLWIAGLYLIVRAVIEPFVIDLSDPATYHLDWGGPHLAGVLAVHCGPGIVAAALIARRVVRHRTARPADTPLFSWSSGQSVDQIREIPGREKARRIGTADRPEQ